jgi:hypothetical protein
MERCPGPTPTQSAASVSAPIGENLMSLRWPLLLLLVTSTNLHATQFPIEIFEYVDSARVVAFINESDLDASTRWHPFEGPPPLGIQDVTAALRSFIASDEVLAGATLTEIELKRVPHREKDWHYMVKLKTGGKHGSHYHYLVVLMSGKVIPAIREPESFK